MNIDYSQVTVSTTKSSQYDPEDHQQDHYCSTTLKYNGQEVYNTTSHASTHIGGYAGHEHRAELSADKKKLTITSYPVGKWAGGDEKDTVTVVDVAEKIAEKCGGVHVR